MAARNLACLVSIFAVVIGLPSARAQSAPAPGADTFAVLHVAPSAAHSANEPLQARVARQLEAARERGAAYVVLPELSLVGRGEAPRPEPLDGPTAAWFAAQARRLGLWIAYSLPEATEGGYHVATVLVDDRGQTAAVFRAVMVPAERGAVRGNFRETIDTVDDDGLRLGVVSGHDLMVGVPRLADRGAHVILVTADWDASATAEWAARCRDLVREYKVGLVVASRGDRPGAHDWVAVFHTGDAPRPEQRRDGVAIVSLPRPARDWQVDSSLGLPLSIPFPTHQPGSTEIADLGRRLFIDTRLSSSGEVACSSCHQPERAFTNGETKGTGVHGRQTKRNVPSLLNVAFRPLLQWDGYASSLENFAKYPISGFNEMNMHYLDQLVLHLRSRPEYVEAFRKRMGVETIEFEHAALALAQYQRTLVSGNSPFDRHFYGGDTTAMSASAQRGLKLFQGQARCATCHAIGDRYATFTDLKYYDLGVGYTEAAKKYQDIGLGGISTDDFSGLFQTPSLRNVAETAPYMHDGSVASLEEAVELHLQGGRPSPRLSREALEPVALSAADKADLVAFLRALSGEQRYSRDGHLLQDPACDSRLAGNPVSANKAAQATRMEAP